MMPKQLLPLVALVFVSAAWSQPKPAALTGDLEDGATITIDGAGFGDGPNLVVFDNFEAGTDGDEIAFDKATVGRWFASEGSPVYVSEGARSGQMAMLVSDNGDAKKVTAGDALPDGSSMKSIHDGLLAFREVFYSFAVRDLGNFPGPNGGPDQFSDESSLKDTWMMLGFAGDSRFTKDQGNDLYIPSWAGNFLISGNNSTDTSYWLDGLRDNWAFGEWNVLSFYAKVPDDDPYSGSTSYLRYFNDSNGLGIKEYNDELMFVRPDLPVEPYWDRIKFGAWYRGENGNVRRIMDDIYVALGSNAQARVELGNASTYEKSTKFALLTPTNWAAGSIKATIRSGGFTTDELKTSYIYVIDGAGRVNANGLAACPTCPRPAEILQ